MSREVLRVSEDSSLQGPSIEREMLVEGVVTVSDAVAFLGLSRTTLWSMMDSGELSWLKLRGKRMIPRRALFDCLNQIANPDHQGRGD